LSNKYNSNLTLRKTTNGKKKEKRKKNGKGGGELVYPKGFGKV
jgi:hypothetical protein